MSTRGAENVVEFEIGRQGVRPLRSETRLLGATAERPAYRRAQRLFNEQRMPGGKCFNIGERRRDGPLLRPWKSIMSSPSKGLRMPHQACTLSIRNYTVVA